MIGLDPSKLIAPALAVAAAFLVMNALERRGEQKALANVEKQNVQVTSKAGSAGRKSADPGARGVRDPYGSGSN